MKSQRVGDQVLTAGIGAITTQPGIKPDLRKGCAGRNFKISKSRLSQNALQWLQQTMRDVCEEV
ncbi:MAG: hypothetical protein Q8M31_01955 [Beijerinckiaceae bacterium]|nr:hypothetical protein [Beijerinckiaceae bacterium]